MTALSEHFSLEEMIVSQTAARLGIDNTPSPAVVGHLTNLANCLEAVRVLLGFPLIISSGYRSPELNKALGGVMNSAHVDGDAADFLCPGFGAPSVVCQKIADSGMTFDQLINEGGRPVPNPSTGWTHISFADTARRQVLAATFDARGKASYSEGNQIT